MIDVSLIFKIFILLNPLSSIPVLCIAHGHKYNVKRVAVKAVILAFVVALLFVLLGQVLFKVYDIHISSFRAAGGVLIALLGLTMARDNRDYKETKPDALVSLIATPLLTGPATLSFLILTAAEIGPFVLITNLVFSFMLVGTVFILAASMIPNINLEHIRFLSRLLGLFLLALGIEMIAAGLKGLLLGT